MALTFIGLPAGNNGTSPPRTPLFSDTLSWFNSALEARDVQVRTTRGLLARRIRRLRAVLTSRVAKLVDRSISAIISSVRLQLAEVDTRALRQAHEIASQALREFLDAPALEPILQQRLLDQVTKIYQQLPNRFTQLFVNPSQSVPDNDDLEIIRDASVAIGCARLVGRSGEISLDWRSALQGGAR